MLPILPIALLAMIIGYALGRGPNKKLPEVGRPGKKLLDMGLVLGYSDQEIANVYEGREPDGSTRRDPRLPPIPRAMLPALKSSSPSGSRAMPLSPEQERLLTLLILYAKDRKNPPHRKRYLTAPMAEEALRLTRVMNLPRTSRVLKHGDRPIPDDEYIPGRAENLRTLVLTYGTTGRA
jgi:hypothetical protein